MVTYNVFFKKPVWVGYYFPKYHEDRFELTSKFESRQQCIDWLRQKEGTRKPGEGSYEYWCGLNCDEGRFALDACEVMSNEEP